MKLTKTSWLILTLGILVITFASLGAARSQKLNEGQQLSEDLAMAEMRLSKFDLKQLYSQQKGLEEQINQTTSQLEIAKASLSQPNDSITISDAVFRIAEACGVEVIEISSSSLTQGKLDKVGGPVLPLNTLVRGNVPNLIDFVIRLNKDLPTGVVKSAQITVPTATDNTTATATDNTTAGIKPPSATIQLEVFAYQKG